MHKNPNIVSHLTDASMKLGDVSHRIETHRALIRAIDAPQAIVIVESGNGEPMGREGAHIEARRRLIEEGPRLAQALSESIASINSAVAQALFDIEQVSDPQQVNKTP